MRRYRELLASARTRSSLMRVVREEVTPVGSPGYKRIKQAAGRSRDLYGTLRRSNGEYYFTHAYAVALIAILLAGVRDPDVIIACLIHDNREHVQEVMDKHGHFQPQFAQWLGSVAPLYGEKVEKLFAFVTVPRVYSGRTKEESHDLYHQLFEDHKDWRDLFLVKLPDRLHNLWTLHPSMGAEKIRNKIEETEEYYLPYAIYHSILVDELKEALARAKAMLAKLELVDA